MTLLVISPDYASHLLPLATLATAWRTPASGWSWPPARRRRRSPPQFGFDRIDLRLGRGSNPGVIRAEDQPTGEDDALRGFFAATGRGMVDDPAIPGRCPPRRPAVGPGGHRPPGAGRGGHGPAGPDHRRPPGLQRPAGAGRRCDSARGRGARAPDRAAGRRRGLRLSARAAQGVRARRRRPWPACCTAAARCGTPSPASGTPHWPRLRPGLTRLSTHSPSTRTCPCSTTRRSCTTPPALRSLPPHAFLGSAVRQQPPRRMSRPGWTPTRPRRWSTSASAASCPSAPTYWPASSQRWPNCRCGWRWPPDPPTGRCSGRYPDGWLVREFLPQVALLGRCAVAVTHGGNNSVTESLHSGVPMLVLPFSTDQFAGAAAIETCRCWSGSRPERGVGRRSAGRRRVPAGRRNRRVGRCGRFSTPAGARSPDRPGRADDSELTCWIARSARPWRCVDGHTDVASVEISWG